MKRFVLKLFQDVQRGENVDLLVTVALVLVISVLDGLGLASVELVSSITLTTLGLIAIGLLVTRYRLEDIHRQQDVANLVHLQMQRSPALDDELASATEIWMTGITLRGTTTRYFHDLERRAAQGGRFRALIVDVDRIEMAQVLRQFARGGQRAAVSGRIHANVEPVRGDPGSGPRPRQRATAAAGFCAAFSALRFPPGGGRGRGLRGAV